MKTTTITEIPPNCPECRRKMHKAGFTWSGRHKRRMWKCSSCGRTKLGDISSNGHNPNALQSTRHTAPREIAMPRAGGEDTFLDKPPRICPADSNPDVDAKGCAFYLNGHCNRFSYPFGCRLGLSREGWEALPTS